MVKTAPGRKALSSREIEEQLHVVSGWTVQGGKLSREVHFANFVEAFGFMSSVALVAERSGHHPDWSNVYNRVTMQLWTHDCGAVTETDFALAREINSILERYTARIERPQGV